MRFITLAAVVALLSNPVLSAMTGPNDPRIEQWNRMKIAMPDGILPEENPIVRVDEEQGSPLTRPMHRNQLNQGQGYKQMAMPQNLKHVAPLPPRAAQVVSSRVSKQAASPTPRPFRKLIALDDKGNRQTLSTEENSARALLKKGLIQEKQVVGMDSEGNVEILDIPAYNRH
ncbi:hypothetical protein RMATCC62417_03299 [Rhizopus microsporus]|nr:hypothetical protein RMATCC62417_03299 [Rhizopus microsporus]CEI96980.1 hypothetical protein RMCBS344292_11123 [Rhizopus microsporus]